MHALAYSTQNPETLLALCEMSWKPLNPSSASIGAEHKASPHEQPWMDSELDSAGTLWPSCSKWILTTCSAARSHAGLPSCTSPRAACDAPAAGERCRTLPSDDASAATDARARALCFGSDLSVKFFDTSVATSSAASPGAMLPVPISARKSDRNAAASNGWT